MNNEIKLSFDKTVTRLAGNPYGRLVYEEQVKGKVDYNEVVYITFPDEIIYIASSFVQGFFDEIIKKVGVLGVGRQVIITANGIDVNKTIIKNLI